MKFITEKKVHSGIVMAVLYVTFCGAFFFPSREAFVAMFSAFPDPSVLLCNDVVSFFFGGLIPWGLYELITAFALRFSTARLGGKTDIMKYALRWFFIPANVVLCLVKLLYLRFPLLHVYGDVLFDFVAYALAIVAFLIFCAKKIIDKENLAVMFYQLGGTAIIVLAFFSVVNIVLGVVA